MLLIMSANLFPKRPRFMVSGAFFRMPTAEWKHGSDTHPSSKKPGCCISSKSTNIWPRKWLATKPLKMKVVNKRREWTQKRIRINRRIKKFIINNKWINHILTTLQVTHKISTQNPKYKTISYNTTVWNYYSTLQKEKNIIIQFIRKWETKCTT